MKERRGRKMSEIKLKPCPFCGCDDRRIGIRKMGRKGYRVICARCRSMGSQINIIDNDKMGAQKMAAEAWNRRAENESRTDKERNET